MREIAWVLSLGVPAAFLAGCSQGSGGSDARADINSPEDAAVIDDFADVPTLTEGGCTGSVAWSVESSCSCCGDAGRSSWVRVDDCARAVMVDHVYTQAPQDRCVAELPPCGTPGAVTPCDLQLALQNADVQAAQQTTNPAYGCIPPMQTSCYSEKHLVINGQSIRIVIAEGDATCNDSIPRGIKNLTDLIASLGTQIQSGALPCVPVDAGGDTDAAVDGCADDGGCHDP